jgi:hypothetical protein
MVPVDDELGDGRTLHYAVYDGVKSFFAYAQRFFKLLTLHFFHDNDTKDGKSFKVMPL